MILSIILAAILLLAGLGLLVIGVHGRKIDDHPLCRKCGFDLTGLPGGVHRCSECGSYVTSPRARRIGHRQKIKWLIATGSSLVLVCGSALGLAGWVVSKGIDVNEYKPVWLLLRETAGNSMPARNAALAELFNRVSRGQMPAGKIDLVVDRALTVQADMSRPWFPVWGDIVEAAHGTGKVSQQHWRRYVSQAPVIEIVVPPYVRKGAPLPIRRDFTARVGKRGMVFVKRNGISTTVDERACDDRMGRGLELAALDIGVNTYTTLIWPEDPTWGSVAEGEHVIRWSIDIWYYDSAPKDFEDTLPAVNTARRDFTAKVTILPRTSEHTPDAVEIREQH